MRPLTCLISRSFVMHVLAITLCFAPGIFAGTDPSPALSSDPPSRGGFPLLDHLGIEIASGSRPFVFTNKQTAFLYGETGGPNTTSWQGFNVFGREFLDDYEVLINGEPLPRRNITRTRVYPDHLERNYPGGIVEELWPVDSLSLFGIILRAPTPVDAGIRPFFTDGRTSADYKLALRQGVALVARMNHLERTPSANYPVWFAIAHPQALPDSSGATKGRAFSPVRLYAPKQRVHLFGCAVGNTQDATASLALSFEKNSAHYAAARRSRLEQLLASTRIQTGNPTFDSAYAWAVLSLDALMMNQSGKGIFAGLPWFNNYWGRDTFVALPGAALVTGRFREAREILRSFSGFQERDPASPNFGKIPNIVTTTETAFNTADGTPRFVMMVRDYVERSGDESLLLELYPVILRSIDGTLRYHVDAMGFLTHRDADTWMDAVGPDGPWSPRGNRANDIQALWALQLETGIWCATRLGDVESARTWHNALTRLKEQFSRRFVINGQIADHLNADDTPDLLVRPNQIFTASLLDSETRARMVRTVVTELTYPYGVASLAQTEDRFHPYHEYPPYYPKDEAYHNGTVWTWVQGPVISALCGYGLQDSAFVVTMNTVHQILHRGAVGTQSELLDALARPGEPEPRLSGTVSQAWNLGEHVRNIFDDYLGVRIERLTRQITLRPRLPRALGNVHATVNLDGVSVPLVIRSPGTEPEIDIDAGALSDSYDLTLDLPRRDAAGVTICCNLPARSRISVILRDTLVLVSVNGNPVRPAVRLNPPASYTAALKEIHLAIPHLRPGLQALAGPGYPLLKHSDIKRRNARAIVIFHAEDARGDDTGVGAVHDRGGRFEYPANSNFVPGSFDLRECTVRSDSTQVYFNLRFTSLPDPGWHPEYGFQLTLAAIAIDTDGIDGSGATMIPANALYRLPRRAAYERLILVGGGIRVEDNNGKTLGAYIPAPEDVAHPLGNSGEGTISFSLPITLLGRPAASWRFTLVAGAQDDHGGAGIGEFRTVDRVRGEWNGGGRLVPEESNVYDELVAP
jgi:glycogen debranching enzyme